MKKDYVQLSQFPGAPINHFSPNRVKRVLWYFLKPFLIETKNHFIPNWLKISFLRFCGAKIGKDVVFMKNINLQYPWKLEIGDNVWVGEKSWLYNIEKIVINDNSVISQGAMLLTGNHDYKKVSFDTIQKPIHLEQGVWVGARAIICPGVKLRSHSIISVNSVIIEDTKAYGIYQGNPAKYKRQRIIQNS